MRRPVGETICRCSDCLAQGSVDHTGKALGKVWPSAYHIKLHLNRVHQEKLHTSSAEDPPPAEVLHTAEALPNELVDSLFALTLLDNGPEVNGQPPCHWTSQANYQEDNMHTNILPDRSHHTPLDDIVAGVNRLTIQRNSQCETEEPSLSLRHIDVDSVSSPHEESITLVPPLSHLRDLEHKQGQLTLGSRQAQPELVPRSRLGKADQSKRSRQALHHLNNIKLRISACWETMFASPSTESSHCPADLQVELTHLRSALEGVRHQTPFVIQCKEEVKIRLDDLDAHFHKWKTIMPETDPHPEYYNCGENCLDAYNFLCILTKEN
jgi:hypothetical protein